MRAAWRSSRRDDRGVSRNPPIHTLPGPPVRPLSTVPTTTGPRVVVLLFDALTPWWAAWRLVRGPGALRGTPGLRFAKVLGSGHEGGFGLRPSATRGGLLCAFDTPGDASAFMQHSDTVAQCRRHARELCTAVLRPYASRGTWDGQALPAALPPSPQDLAGPVAALTRASIRPARALAFWRMAPPAQAAMADAAGCRLGVGLGEAPLLRQATFSLWDSVAHMDAYARGGAHLQAIRASQQGGHFSESMFVRFVPESVQGIWKGRRLG